MEEKLFLEENYNEEMNNYKKITNGQKKSGWDWIIITASNKEQKESYVEQINFRKKIGFFPKELRIDVVEDPEGKRVGSGGATLNVLKFLHENDEDFFNKKIMLIHSGGDSKRVPSCSACGKLFSNIPRKLFNNRCSTLFDEFMISFSDVPSRLKNGILVLSGDVLLLFNSLQIDIHNFDVVSISIKVPKEIGQNHGVVLADSNNTVKRFLHKLSIEELEKYGAVDNEGYVNLDTGCIWMSSAVIQSLFELISKNNKIDNELYKMYINDTNRLSFYGDLLFPFSSEGSEEEYLQEPSEGIYNDNLKIIRKIIWRKLHNYKFGIVKTSPSKFIHAGTTLELKNLFINAKKNYSYLSWNNNILTNEVINNVSLINSLIYTDTDKIGNDVLIENSIIKENSIIGKNCLLSNTIFSGTLQKNTVIHTLPLKIDENIKYVTRIYGVYDNPKNNNQFLGISIKDFKEKNNLQFEEKSLWELKLYPICDSVEESVNFAITIQNMVLNIANESEINEWKKAKKLSLEESFNLADTREILKWQERLEYQILADIIVHKFTISKMDVNNILKYINSQNVVPIVEHIKTKCDDDYKLCLLLSKIIEEYNSKFDAGLKEFYEDKCYNIISKKVIDNNKISINQDIKLTNEKISNCYPVRINLGGGWSDTAPYCLENGGIVLNAAVYLNDELPIKVTVEKNNEKKFIFVSKDGNCKEEFLSVNEFKDLDLIGDVFILTKASILLLNINDEILNDYGITVTTDVNVPKGSGLGTSSILAAGIIQTLAEFCSYKLTNEEVASLVLCAEQIISSGGGWQDQIGGITQGIKLIETSTGENQNYNITYIKDTKGIVSILNKRLVLIYAGQRRIAKNLLRKIMNKYILNDTTTIDVLRKIQHIALLMKFELEKGSIQGFCKLLNEHFELSKILDEGVTNLCIEHLIATTKDLVDGYFIAGAGGGGFLVAVLKNENVIDELKSKISTVYKDIGIEVFNCKIKYE